MAKTSLSIISLDEYSLDPTARLNERTVVLERTPRRLVQHPLNSELVVVIEGDRDSYEKKPGVDSADGGGSNNNNSAKGGHNNDDKEKSRAADDMDVDEDDEMDGGGGGGGFED